MKFSLKTLAATAALGLAASSAFAAVPSVPGTLPVSGPTPDPGTGDGGLIVSVFDAVRGVSLVEYLGLTYSQILPGAGNATPEAGLSLNFGALTGYSSLFASSVQSNIKYTVMASDQTPDAGHTTIGLGLATTLSTVGTIRNSTVTTATTTSHNFIASALDGVNGCNGVNPCIANASSDAQYAGGGNWGSSYNAGLSASGTVGSSLNFYLLTASSDSAIANATKVQYANSTGAATWLLDTNGNLTYSLAGGAAPVPLPAAVWLLVSGLMGLGTISRRRSAGAAV